ncbi:MAG: transposase [Planctomycetes bacterium]|nr:transposase [Planctomycetota bacterium]
MPDPYEIAAWRFEQIAFLIDPSLDAARRRAALRQRTTKPVPRPWDAPPKKGERRTSARPIGKSTLYRWLAAYQEHGFVGLLSKARTDRGCARRPGTATWVAYAIALLYEQPDRSLWQLEVYLRAEFPEYCLGRSTLRRHLRAHPAFGGIARLRSGKPRKLRDRYEADHPHEGWQLDGKGPFPVRFADGTQVHVHVLTVLDDHSRKALAAVVARQEDTEAAIRVFEKAVAKWGLAERFQFDRGSAFDSNVFRKGLAALGVHRNYIEARSPEWDGKIEAYHRSLGRWFVNELRAQEVVDLEHLQQLLDAMLALVYDRHLHREIKTTPERRLAGRCSTRQVSQADVERAFYIETTASSCKKTGAVRLPNGSFRVPSVTFAGRRCRFRHHPFHDGRAVLVTADDREIELQPFTVKPLSAVKAHTRPRGTGQLQKLVDLWQGKERPNAQPGFGLPEVFAAIGRLVERMVPDSEREARSILGFYRKHGPLPREGFELACERSRARLGAGRPLHAYLADLERQIDADRQSPDTDQETP